MDLRRLCNVAYAYLVENMDVEGQKRIDGLLDGSIQPAPATAAAPAATLPGVPQRPAPAASDVGMKTLMAAMLMPQKGQPARRRAKPKVEAATA